MKEDCKTYLQCLKIEVKNCRSNTANDLCIIHLFLTSLAFDVTGLAIGNKMDYVA